MFVFLGEKRRAKNVAVLEEKGKTLEIAIKRDLTGIG